MLPNLLWTHTIADVELASRATGIGGASLTHAYLLLGLLGNTGGGVGAETQAEE